MKKKYNENRMDKRRILWVAQQQEYCPVCGIKLLETTRDNEAQDLELLGDDEAEDVKLPKLNKVVHKPTGGYLVHNYCLKVVREEEEKEEKLSKKKALKLMRERLIKLINAQGDCPKCHEPLISGSDLSGITYDHKSGNYDHQAKEERGKSKGGIFMHSTCHKSKTMKELEIYKNRSNVRDRAAASLDALRVGQSHVFGKAEDIENLFDEVAKDHPEIKDDIKE